MGTIIFSIDLADFVSMAKSSFKLEHPLERRQAEATRIREKYPDIIPVIVERADKSDVPDIDKKKNGDTYAREYFADKTHGFGVYYFANGHLYEDAWHEGRRQGIGMYTFRSGETQSGHWQNGILDVPSTRNNTYLVSPVAVYHSKVLNAVQVARRATEKAYNVAKVDERVNKAVASVNRAVNAARVIAIKAVQKQMDHNHNNNNAV
ncbi:hypothetical protein E1A91_D06G153700v1 [Gossypium mustelinum]|uniref:Autophagy-related protein n=1 Tax=Gossypium mustelinum TaxID=34275 RepID=A0A5D2ULD7_GOSMU|nr:hypothetical protein E1A91_D06G153700v1 [Gossypium mustelinum]